MPFRRGPGSSQLCRECSQLNDARLGRRSWSNSFGARVKSAALALTKPTHGTNATRWAIADALRATFDCRVARKSPPIRSPLVVLRAGRLTLARWYGLVDRAPPSRTEQDGCSGEVWY